MLQIRKHGKLIKKEWNGDLGDYEEIDITDQGIRSLFDCVTLDDGVLLRDIFLLLSNDLDIYDAILGNWCKQLVEEGLTGTPKKVDQYDPDEIEYLELYYTPEYQKGLDVDHTIDGTTEGLHGLAMPGFHGQGWKLKADKKDGHGPTWSAGERIPWGLSLSPVNELIDLPVKLNPDFHIYEEDYSDPTKNAIVNAKCVAKLQNPEFTLGQVLYSIIWELSFHGGPEDRDSMSGKLKGMAKDIQADDGK